MEYSQAKKLREKSLGTLLAEQEGGAFSSLKKAVSLKTQAKMTGMQEKFDPMNIAKFMTMGSNWAPAMLGKLTNRKQSSIDYFTGVKRKSKGKGIIEKLSNSSGEGGDVLGILQSIESLLHTTREDDKLKAEEEKNFEEERNLEKAKRHKALMEAITGKPYTEKTPTATKEEEDTSSWTSWLDGLGWLKYIVLGPAGGLVALLAGIGISAYLLQKLADNTNNMKALSPEEASNILSSNNTKDIDAAGGRDYLENIIKNRKKEAQDALSMPEGEERNKKLIELGGEDKVKKIAESADIEVPVNTGESNLAKKLPFTKEQFIGKGSARKSKESKWNKEYAPYYDDNGLLKSATPVNNNEGNEQFKKESEEWANKQSNVAPVASESPAPVSEAPKSGAQLNQVQKANLDLNLPQSKSDPTSVVNNNVNNVSKNGKPRGIIPSVRNNEETIQRLIFNSTRVV